MRRITIAFEETTVASLDELAASGYGGDRNAAVHALLEAWLAKRC